jgi:hypothetical protein
VCGSIGEYFSDVLCCCSNPIPSSLRNECRKASRILTEFIDPKQSFGPDKIIPPSILADAKVGFPLLCGGGQRKSIVDGCYILGSGDSYGCKGRVSVDGERWFWLGYRQTTKWM